MDRCGLVMRWVPLACAHVWCKCVDKVVLPQDPSFPQGYFCLRPTRFTIMQNGVHSTSSQ